jgi:hypothetical protein
MKKIIFLTVLLIGSICSGQNNKIDSLFMQFKKASFYENVYPSKLALENYQKEIIPELVALVSDTTFVKLIGTADLIYPGAEKYFGHGHYIPYAMDWISIRAGWLLQELTFEDFGYETTNTGNLSWKDKPTAESVKKMRKEQAACVQKWWKENKNKWSRINALREAFKSNDIRRISNAIQFIRYGKTDCDNYNTKDFLVEIRPIIQDFKKSNNQDLKDIGSLFQD